jgi:membrane protease YdiL (CAAX protease family)
LFTNTHSRNKILTFLGLTLLGSAIFYFLIISSGNIEAAGGLYVLGLMWTPGISGLITQLVFEHSLRGMGWKLGKAKYLAIAYFLPVAYCLVVYGITWLTGLGGVPNPDLITTLRTSFGQNTSTGMVIFYFVFNNALFGVLISLLSALGEEIGWRGVFVPELAKNFSFAKTALISGVVWALWHFPLIFFSNYNMPGIPRWYAGIMFFILVVGISFAFAWLRLKSGSLWTAALLHASHNLFIQSIFTPLTSSTAITPFVIDEFGVGLAICAVIIAVFLWRKESRTALSAGAAG